MASEIRVNQIQNRSGLSTVTFTDTGLVISGVTTVSGILNAPVRSNNIGVNTNNTQTAEVYIVGSGKTEGLIISKRDPSIFTPLVIENYAAVLPGIGSIADNAPILKGKRYTNIVDRPPDGYDGTYFEFALGNGDGLFNITAGARYDRLAGAYLFEGSRGASRILLGDGITPNLYGSTVSTGTTGAAVTWNQVYPPPVFRARQTSTQTVNNGVTTKITYTTEDFDTHSFYDTSTSRFAPTIPGYYQLTATIRMASPVNNHRVDMAFYINGVENIATGSNQQGSNDTSTSITAILYLNGSQYVEVYVNQNSGNNLGTSNNSNTGGAGTIMHFSGQLIHPG